VTLAVGHAHSGAVLGAWTGDEDKDRFEATLAKIAKAKPASK
jgi:hypothetical protein